MEFIDGIYGIYGFITVSNLIFLVCTSQDEFRNLRVWWYFLSNLPAISCQSCKKMYLHGILTHILSCVLSTLRLANPPSSPHQPYQTGTYHEFKLLAAMATKSLKYLGNICGDSFSILRPDPSAGDLIWEQALLCRSLHDGSNTQWAR